MEFITEYGLFLLKAATVVVSFVVVFGAIFAQAAKSKGHSGSADGHISIQNLNDKYKDYEHSLKQVAMSEHAFKEDEKLRKKEAKSEKKQEKKSEDKKPRIFVINFEGDVKASAVEHLREEVSAILTIAEKPDEVVINIDSPGGMVHTYGLAASQLTRIKDAGYSSNGFVSIRLQPVADI